MGRAESSYVVNQGSNEFETNIKEFIAEFVYYLSGCPRELPEGNEVFTLLVCYSWFDNYVAMS